MNRRRLILLAALAAMVAAARPARAVSCSYDPCPQPQPPGDYLPSEEQLREWEGVPCVADNVEYGRRYGHCISNREALWGDHGLVK